MRCGCSLRAYRTARRTARPTRRRRESNPPYEHLNTAVRTHLEIYMYDNFAYADFCWEYRSPLLPF